MRDLNDILKHPSVDDLRRREGAKYGCKYFSEHYWREDLPGLTGNRGLSYDDPDHRLRFGFLYDVIVKQDLPQSLVDIGCGPGYLLEIALSNGIDARGVDVSETARDLFCSRTPDDWRDRFVVGPMTTMPFPDREFELCLCLDVLEHVIVFDIFSAVQELCRVSSKNVICSINLDNPYQFHPTVLSRESWVAVFESSEMVRYHKSRTEELNRLAAAKRPEYEFFAFQRI